jgi:hypothetical protein
MTEKIRQNSPKSDNAQPSGSYSGGSFNQAVKGSILTGTTKWSQVRLHLERIASVVNAATPGSYTEIDIPFP